MRVVIWMRKGDWIFIAILLLVGGALWLFLRPDTPAQTAQIYCAGELVAELPLGEDDSYRWEEGDAYVSIEITAGGARVTDASCPDGDCIKRGTIYLAGESIVCLPNRISVVLSGADSLDAVVY